MTQVEPGTGCDTSQLGATLRNVAVVGEIPSWLDVSFVTNAAAVLAVAATVALLVVMFLVRSVALRLITILVLGAAVFGLLHYRSELTHCDNRGCACSFFGQDLKGSGCTSSR